MKNGLICKGDNHLPYNPKLKDRSRRLRNEMTPAEKKLWFEFLRKHSIGFTRQKPLHHYIVDFYCSKARLVIEVDGSQHWTKSGLAYDQERTAIMESYNLEVIRFPNFEILNNFEAVCAIINKTVENRL